MDTTFLAGPDNDLFVVTVFLSALLFAAAVIAGFTLLREGEESRTLALGHSGGLNVAVVE